MKTPAVTMVAAWMRAETGVGPSIASGNQVCRPSWADLPMAPMNSRMQMRVSAWPSMPKTETTVSACSGTAEKTVSNSAEPSSRKAPAMPRAKPTSPTRLTRKALIAALFALGRSYQKPISR